MIIAVILLQLIQYGGSPMWDRGPNPEYRRERQFPVYPPPRRYGPQFVPCIGAGDCQGPNRGYQGRPRFEPPPRYDDEWEE